MRATNSFLLLVATLACFIERGTSLKCYSCHSSLGGACANPQGAKVDDCGVAEARCYMLTQIKGLDTFVQRGCISGANTCPHTQVDFACTWCNHADLCNSVVFDVTAGGSTGNENGDGDSSSLTTPTVFLSILCLILSRIVAY